MERRQTGVEADESVFFFLNGTERERHAEVVGWKERSEGWRGGGRGVVQAAAPRLERGQRRARRLW